MYPLSQAPLGEKATQTERQMLGRFITRLGSSPEDSFSLSCPVLLWVGAGEAASLVEPSLLLSELLVA